MKKILFFALLVLLASCVIDLDGNPEFSAKHESRDVVVFLKLPTCSRSQAAEKYLKENYRVPVYFVNIDRRENLEWIKAAQYDYELKKTWGDSVPTPIICLGENCIVGWDYTKERLLDQYIQPYLTE